MQNYELSSYKLIKDAEKISILNIDFQNRLNSFYNSPQLQANTFPFPHQNRPYKFLLE